MLRVLIAGSRYFNDYNYLEEVVDDILCENYIYNNRFDRIEIISGCYKGADQLGIKYAINRNYQLKRIPADWDSYGKKAGPIRNAEMARYLKKDDINGICICFWDGQSKGTSNMINVANNLEIPTYIINYKEEEFNEEEV